MDGHKGWDNVMHSPAAGRRVLAAGLVQHPKSCYLGRETCAAENNGLYFLVSTPCLLNYCLGVCKSQRCLNTSDNG
ncbi:hypothetical protein VTI74DRAFT_7454 [Chaetomium olivicolor]